MSKPLALTEDQIKALERRVKERWQIHPDDMKALFAMAREFNAMKQTAQPVSATYTL